MRGAASRGTGARGPATLSAFVTGLLVLAAAWLLPPAALAAQKALVFEHFDALIEVQPSGDVIITETLRPRFTGDWNGIVRRLDLRHTTAAGDRERLEVELLSASDGTGNALRTEDRPIGKDTREVKVWVPDARDRTATVVVRYRVRGAVRHFAASPAEGGSGSGDAAAEDLDRDYDELYWQVTGTDWEVPIEDVTARVVLPVGAEAIRAAAYRGRAASTAPADVEVRTGAHSPTGTGELVVPGGGYLRPGEGLTVAVAWPAGHVQVPAGLARARPVRFGPTGSVLAAEEGPVYLGNARYRALLPLLLPFLVFWLAYRAWDRRGRDPKERAITVRWEPPAGLNAAEAGTLIDHDPGMHDIISTLVDLAVRGYVVISERKKKGFLKFGTDYAFHRVRPRAEWGDLTRHEHLFLSGLFAGSGKGQVLANLAPEGSFLDGVLETVAGEPAASSAPDGALESVLLSDLQDRFYKKIPAIKDALLDGLVEKGYYLRRPDHVRMVWGVIAVVATLTLGIIAAAGFSTGTATGVAFGLAMVVATGTSAVILAVFAWIMPARTEQGARVREATLGFKRFLERVESPRYRRMITTPDQFERYLPYAMAFRCADRWARAFDDLLSEPPDWYHGHHGAFRATAFATDLTTMASAASTTLASSPSSSGSGGGGSVGGGSGGGGGGGF